MKFTLPAPAQRNTAKKDTPLSELQNSAAELAMLKDISLKFAREAKEAKETTELLHSKLNMQIKTERKAEKLLIANKELEKVNSRMETKLEEKNIQLKRKRSEADYRQHKITRLEKSEKEKEDRIKALEDKIANLEKDLEKTKSELNESVAAQECMEEVDGDSDTITTFRDGKYTPEMQTCVYSLLQAHVSFANIPHVIEAVLKLCGKTASNLPSKATIHNMNVQRLVLSQKQLADQFAQEKDTCLLSDETSKRGTKMEGFHAADTSGKIWVLGLREIQTKSAKDVHDTFMTILKDIDRQSKESTNEVSRNILFNLSSRMSDRAATEIKLNESGIFQIKNILLFMQMSPHICK